jgi:G3E family GTPase
VTPVTVLTGFLGSGKTTLLNRLLRDERLADTAVIVNEFGEIGLDHLLIERAEENVVLLDSGCLCCTVSGSLRETLADLQLRRKVGELPAFRRVVIETTGLADPGPILATLAGDRLVTDHFRLAGLVACIDGLNALEEFAEHEEAVRQAAMADRLVLTKTDLAPPERLGVIRRELERRNPAAPVIESGAEAPAPALLLDDADDPARLRQWIAEERYHAHDHRHDEEVAAACFLVDEDASWAGVAAWTQLMEAEHGEKLLRVKALVRIAETGEAVAVQGVRRLFAPPQRLAAWPYGEDRRARVVVIARGLPRDAIAATLGVLALPPGSQRPLSFADFAASR